MKLTAGDEERQQEQTGQEQQQEESGKKLRLFPFTATFVGTSRNVMQQQVVGDQEHIRFYDSIDYFSVSDDGTMSDDAVLTDRVKREQQSLVNFNNGIVKKLAGLRNVSSSPSSCSWDGGYEFLGAVQEFVLEQHKAYCVHDAMMSFPRREVWMTNETY